MVTLFQTNPHESCATAWRHRGLLAAFSGFFLASRVQAKESLTDLACITMKQKSHVCYENQVWNLSTLLGFPLSWQGNLFLSSLRLKKMKETSAYPHGSLCRNQTLSIKWKCAIHPTVFLLDIPQLSPDFGSPKFSPNANLLLSPQSGGPPWWRSRSSRPPGHWQVAWTSPNSKNKPMWKPNSCGELGVQANRSKNGALYQK